MGRLRGGFTGSIAALMLAAYVIVYWADFRYAHSSPPWRRLVQAHTSVGMTIGALVLFRLYWRLVNAVPRPEPVSADSALRRPHQPRVAVLLHDSDAGDGVDGDRPSA